MKTTSFFVVALGIVGILSFGLGLAGNGAELGAKELETSLGGLPLSGMKCVTIGDCTAWNIANMQLCGEAPLGGGCTVCDSEELVSSCFVGSASDVCDWQGARTVDCGSVLAGECDANGECTINLTPISGSACTDGPKCQ